MEYVLILLSAFYAWRHSKLSVDPDWAYFNLYAFTGAMYGRDFADCKTPGVHIWYWLLSKLVGKNVQRIKFANHFLVSMASIPVFYAVGFWAAVAFIVMVNSGWLMAFHGNVGQVPAALIVIALVSPAYLAIPLWLMAVFYEPKLIVALAAVAIFNGWYFLTLLVPIGVIAFLTLRKYQWFKWVWESSYTIPKRIGLNRDHYNKFLAVQNVPWFTAMAAVYILPWFLMSLQQKPWQFWVAPLAFLVFLVMGKVVRPNRLLPMAAWAAIAVPAPVAIALCVTDWISGGLYFGDGWLRWYSSLAQVNEDARDAGEWMKDKEGVLYVNSIHTAIYLYSGKKVPFGFSEEIEIRDNAHERRNEMMRQWSENPPDWVVSGELPGINFVPRSYVKVAQFGVNIVYKKAGVVK